MTPRRPRPWLAALALLAGLGCASGEAPEESRSPASPALLQETLRAVDPEARVGANSIELRFAEVEMACIWDEANDRMRIIAPVRAVKDLTPEQLGAVFAANFHSALDARYGASQGILYAAFLHPLGSLSREEVLSAVRQVASLVRTFGSTYSSGELVYRDSGQAL